ncbi:MAG: HupE/UreJ family protein [Vicinamibacterales bacterium]
MHRLNLAALAASFRRLGPLRTVALALGLALAASAVIRAHDVPTDVIVRVLVKPEGNRLRVLVRVPMVAMQDMDFPLHGPGYLTIRDADPSLRQAAMTWVARDLKVYENDEPLSGQQLVAVRASLPSDRSFADYDQALKLVLGPRMADGIDIVWQQAMLDTVFEYPIQSDRSRFALEPTLARLGQRTQTVLRFVTADGAVRAFDYRGNPGIVRLDPRWTQAALRFIGLGFQHILDGIDHLLFLACLVIPVRRLRPLVAIVTSFTIAHSVTLIASAFNFAPDTLWFPPLIETLIAISIVYMAVENALDVSPKRRWLITFGFGLVHGFGFSFALRETLQFAGGHMLTSLLSFNVGVELGQLLVITVFVGLTALLFKYPFAGRERAGTILLSAFVANTAWNWTLERGSQLMQYDIAGTLPQFDARLFVPSMRWAMLLLVVGTLVWLMSMVFPRLERDDAA